MHRCCSIAWSGGTALRHAPAPTAALSAADATATTTLVQRALLYPPPCHSTQPQQPGVVPGGAGAAGRLLRPHARLRWQHLGARARAHGGWCLLDKRVGAKDAGVPLPHACTHTRTHVHAYARIRARTHHPANHHTTPRPPNRPPPSSRLVWAPLSCCSAGIATDADAQPDGCPLEAAVR